MTWYYMQIRHTYSYLPCVNNNARPMPVILGTQAHNKIGEWCPVCRDVEKNDYSITGILPVRESYLQKGLIFLLFFDWIKIWSHFFRNCLFAFVVFFFFFWFFFFFFCILVPFSLRERFCNFDISSGTDAAPAVNSRSDLHQCQSTILTNWLTLSQSTN
jgi:hypothetical protein